MCGIAGVLAFAGAAPVAEPAVTRMRETLAHRGPDGAETWVAPHGRVGLGFRRLSIIDLSAEAMQPMANEDGSVRIVFNGEIYNHAEIRRELERQGTHRWRTDHSDTEVVVHAYEQWGIGCLERLRGMFALGIWDDRSQELWLARDRIGIKPLYWATHHGRLVFASEIKALLTDPQLERAVDEESLYHYLSFLTTPAPRTLFRGISKLAGGTWLRARIDGTIREERWWDAWDETEPLLDRSDDELAGLVLEELRTAVRLRKVSDVPVGVFLSGGIDSSTNAALFSEGEDHPVRTFSIGYHGENASYPNELEWARLAASHVGAEHHELVLDVDDLVGFLPEMVRLQDEPIGDPVCVPVYYVSKLARENGVIVCQVGEGADELFCGYPSWRQYLRVQSLDRAPVPRALKRLGASMATRLGAGERRETELLRRGGAGLPVFWSGADAFGEYQKRRLLSPRLRRDLDGLTSWDAVAPIRRRYEDRAWEKSALNWMTYCDLNLRLPELLLMRVDKMSMGVSLEGRVPFLDHRFVGLALSLPTAAKTRNGELKHILKRAVRGVIPDAVVDRPKQGFGVPMHEWFLDRLGDVARRELDAFCRESGLLDPGEVRRYVDARRGTEVWSLLNLALWWRQAIAGEAALVSAA